MNKVLEERNTPLTVNYGNNVCPSCGNTLLQRYQNHCQHCGQALSHEECLDEEKIGCVKGDGIKIKINVDKNALEALNKKIEKMEALVAEIKTLAGEIKSTTIPVTYETIRKDQL